jgi:hypothetical protein
MSYDRSVVLIVAAEDRAEAESFGEGLGHSGQEYAVPLSPTGEEPATHFALHSWASEAFVALLAGTAPSGVPQEAVDRLLPLVRASVSGDAAGHFGRALTEAGLQRIVPTDHPSAWEQA